MLKTNLNLVAVILLAGITCSALAADNPLFHSDEPFPPVNTRPGYFV
jgi:hypothetical protein